MIKYLPSVLNNQYHNKSNNLPTKVDNFLQYFSIFRRLIVSNETIIIKMAGNFTIKEWSKSKRARVFSLKVTLPRHSNRMNGQISLMASERLQEKRQEIVHSAAALQLGALHRWFFDFGSEISIELY